MVEVKVLLLLTFLVPPLANFLFTIPTADDEADGGIPCLLLLFTDDLDELGYVVSKTWILLISEESSIPLLAAIVEGNDLVDFVSPFPFILLPLLLIVPLTF